MRYVVNKKAIAVKIRILFQYSAIILQEIMPGVLSIKHMSSTSIALFCDSALNPHHQIL